MIAKIIFYEWNFTCNIFIEKLSILHQLAAGKKLYKVTNKKGFSGQDIKIGSTTQQNFNVSSYNNVLHQWQTKLNIFMLSKIC